MLGTSLSCGIGDEPSCFSARNVQDMSSNYLGDAARLRCASFADSKVFSPGRTYGFFMISPQEHRRLEPPCTRLDALTKISLLHFGF
ncbi:MAG: hypothetical protein DMG50_13580 [Acidobacteria bacterium]|nr:MAG: hypothetical protein AUH16_06455 [Acidobacteria bacterium 13_2_20CM_57_7]PYU82038.1 MAG: hypothetical protein DMG50_13580 [Acidobacteriota bacterium]